MLNKEKTSTYNGADFEGYLHRYLYCTAFGIHGWYMCLFFYNLPRFSVDLDFDLFSTDANGQKYMFEKSKALLENMVRLRIVILSAILFSCCSPTAIPITISRLRSAQEGSCLILKITMNLRNISVFPCWSARKSICLQKITALTSRSETAMRDIYDIWYFAKNSWDINTEVIKIRTNKTIKEYLADCIAVIERIKDNQILRGLGELLSEKEKILVKNNLRKEVIFMLKNYMSVL